MALPPCTKLQRLDPHTSQDHYYLDDDDICFYIGEYTSRCGYSYSSFNSLILNLKKPPSRRHKPEYRYKLQAIDWVAKCFRKNLNEDMLNLSVTVVPIPPSKTKAHPEYDDRMTEICRRMTHGLASPDVRELIVMKQDTEAFHENERNRMPPDDLIQSMELDIQGDDQVRKNIVLVDDLLTTGSHFKACKNLLLQRFPSTMVIGIFVARRVFLNPFEECPV